MLESLILATYLSSAQVTIKQCNDQFLACVWDEKLSKYVEKEEFYRCEAIYNICYKLAIKTERG